MPHGHTPAGVNPATGGIGAAVLQTVRHGLDEAPHPGLIANAQWIEKACNPTHICLPPRPE